jgi:hypothetical protein
MSKTRKWWLISFFTYAAYIFLLIMFERLLTQKENWTFVDPGLLFIWFASIYHHAYWERGTKLLFWLLIGSPMGLLSNLRQEISQMNPPYDSLDSFGQVSFWMYIGILYSPAIWFWINCFFYRKENLARKKLLKAGGTSSVASSQS